MGIKDILKLVDHTMLSVTATTEDIQKACEDAVKVGAFSVCIPPNYVAFAKKILSGSKVKVCTVVGFPNGYNTTRIKLLETEEALNSGADEIDMVINVGFVKNGDYNKALSEITEIKKVCGKRILKVIIECCYLSEEEKISMCGVVTESGADYIKTSTGFGSYGATLNDIQLMRENIGQHVKIKAAGGISSFGIAQKFIMLGTNRIGSSKLVKIIVN